jgi:hypothetical protein
MTYYKYTTTSTAELVLKNKSLRWSSPLLFNDIEECQFTPFTQEQFLKDFNKYKNIIEQCANGCLLFNISSFSENTRLLIEMAKICKKEGNRLYQPDEVIMNSATIHRDYINKGLIGCFRVLCVTATCDNNLMWAHYGDQHYGCVFELDNVFIEKPYHLREGEVRYHENEEPLSTPLDMFLYGETPEVKELMVKDIIFSKRTNWKYEHEYRYMFSETFGQITCKFDVITNKFEVVTENQSDKFYTDVPISKESIKSIIFGARTAAVEIDKIVGLASEIKCNCKLYQMKMINGKLVKELLSNAV